MSTSASPRLSLHLAFLFAMLLGILATPEATAQPTSSSPLAPPANGPRRADPTWVALFDVTVHAKAGEVAHRAVVVFKDGLIQAVLPGALGADGKEGTDDDVIARAPIGPAIINAKGLHVYPAFIDAYVEVESPAPASRGDGRSGVDSHWNDAVTPQRRALDGPGIDEALAKSLRDMGFGAAAISPRGGIFRGRSAVVSLAKPAGLASADKPPVYADDVYQTFSFETGPRGYPDSQMGAIALVRQTFSDALWQYGSSSSQARNQNGVASCLSLLGNDAMAGKWLVFDSADELEALRANNVWREFTQLGGQGRGMIMLGCGTEYARLAAIKGDAHSYILPLNFPKAPDVGSPGKAESIDLREMMTWEQAATNPRRMAAAGLEFSLTTSKIKKREEFAANLRKSIAFGLKEEQALAALTTTPAALLGLADQLGTIEPGKRANLILATGPIFDKKTKIRTTIIDGVQHEVERAKVDLSGTWRTDMVTPDGAVRTLVIAMDGSVEVVKTIPGEKEGDKPETIKAKARKVVQQDKTLTFVFDHDEMGDDGVASVALTFDVSSNDSTTIDVATGSGRVVLPDGRTVQYNVTREPVSLAGDWPLFFETDDLARQVGGILRVSDAPRLLADRTPTVEIVSFDDAGAETKAAGRDVAWNGTLLTYKLSREDMGGAFPDVTVAIRPDLAASPASLAGSVTNANGSFAFTARKIDDSEKWWKGTWIVVRVDGKPEPNDDPKDDKIRLEFGEKKLAVIFSQPDKPDIRVETEDLKIEGNKITFTHDLKPLGFEGKSTDSITRVAGELRGVSTLPDGSKHEYAARLEVKDDKHEEADFTELAKDVPESLAVPFGPYGLLAEQPQGTFLIQNVTAWTNTETPADESGNQGIIKNATVILQGGIISMVVAGDEAFKFRLPADTITIDGTGKHLTTGIIDAHSHTGISRGVNEGGQAVTSEVRIEDVTNPDDVNWYRQLASGVTTVLQLHGSANAIGGQSQTTKVRWGAPRPEAMRMQGAMAGIKFALGENPKQVNWDDASSRYPRSRMGVEMLIRDRFTAAKGYAAARVGATADKPAPRRDIELDPLAEILAGTRLLHCHSYRQDEIVMLAHVARDFGFKIGTYQHILEGYKVADYVRDFSGGGSGFADWWAYKIEVQDAIPAGLPMMQKVGATTSFNSDSNGLARFLNVEAAKAVKYGREVGGFAESEAWKFVTLNPAKQLRIDNRVGMLKQGYEADVVLWTDHPMSTFARVERTWVDGRELYSIEQDTRHRETIAKERQRLIQKLLKDKKKPGKDSPKEEPRKPENSSVGAPFDQDDTLSQQQRDQLRQLHLEMLSSGRDPRFMPGVCGCGWHAW